MRFTNRFAGALLPLLCLGTVFAGQPVQLYNGKDLTGWSMSGPGRFVVENGLLKTEGGMGLLTYTGRKFGNETVRVVFKTKSDKDNSGVYIRLPEIPKDAYYGVHYGYEVQIDGGGDEYHRTGAIYSLSPSTKQVQKPAGEWNTLDIELQGPVTRVTLNGTLVNEFKPDTPVPDRKQHFEPVRGPRPDYGYIGLQNHDANSTVYFKEISITTPGEPLSDKDRNFLLSQLHASKRELVDSISGLTPEQLAWKPSPDKWSVAEVADHLIKTEPLMYGGLMQMLRLPVNTSAKTSKTDEEVLAQIRDRSKKAEAPPMLRPSVQNPSSEALAEEFSKRRERLLDFVRNTQDDLNHRVRKQGGDEASAYQMILYASGHTDRHVAQIREIKASPEFPKTR
ncbi:MAG TPA: family 16 glycoside hydrolase [Bryobacteraceae bacterium]|nr:family 16 glycoside hydrolase [Bryobacteraceae bacterium]